MRHIPPIHNEPVPNRPELIRNPKRGAKVNDSMGLSPIWPFLVGRGLRDVDLNRAARAGLRPTSYWISTVRHSESREKGIKKYEASKSGSIFRCRRVRRPTLGCGQRQS